MLSTESYTLDQFRAAGARKSIMDRLEALDARGIAITDDILGKIGVAAPNTQIKDRTRPVPSVIRGLRDARFYWRRARRGHAGTRRASATSTRRRRCNASASAPTSARTRGRRRSSRWAWATASALELAAATNVEREMVNKEEAADEQALVRAAAWRAALRVGADDPPRSLSSVCGAAVAVQQGLFDGVSAEDAAVKVDKLLVALPETSVDATKALSDAPVGAEGREAVEGRAVINCSSGMLDGLAPRRSGARLEAHWGTK